MDRAGFILVGGQSSRMGQDKALLPYRGTLLVSWVAQQVEAVAGNVTLVGAPERYRELGFPVIPDSREDCGPLGGIEAALRYTSADWNLIVACDMPSIDAALLDDLFTSTAREDCDCLLPMTAGGLPEPLCGIWHRDALSTITKALDSNIRKITDATASLRVVHYNKGGNAWAANMNTPAEWHSHLRTVTG